MSNAFPEYDIYDERLVGCSSGLTKREYFAIRCLQSILINGNGVNACKEKVRYSIEIADELIRQLDQQ